MRIAINGFGRIGRTFLRTVLQDKQTEKKLEVVAINIGSAQMEFIGHMFKYDTIMGSYPGAVSNNDAQLVIDTHTIEILKQTDPLKCAWKDHNIDWVVDASGAFTHRQKAELHIKAGAKKVLITAPAQEEDISIIPGVNLNLFDDAKHAIVSLGSCTTNAFMPMLKILHDNFKITHGFMNTVHAYTNSQVLLDVEANDLRMCRAAALNIIPATTGASKMIGKIIPELAMVIKASALRVPVPIVSLIDLCVTLQKTVTVTDINAAFEKSSQSSLKNIVSISQDPLVSNDFKGNPSSVIIDALSTEVVGNMAKVMGWYDNEWGYCQRLKDFLLAVC